jgi:hypothetical protein
MSRVLCTFPGKAGDILWSLPTARAIARITGEPVDFAVMPYYESLLPLLQEQEYISRAFTLADWHRTGSAHGDQPEVPQNREIEQQYAQTWHLGYRAHPGITAPDFNLCNFVAAQQSIVLQQPVVPFLKVRQELVEHAQASGDYVAMAFNEQYDEQKQKFRNEFKVRCPREVAVVWMPDLRWEVVPSTIAGALAYVGDRSSNWVIAKGVDAQALTYEPHPHRNAHGPFGHIFGCPYGRPEIAVHHGTAPCTAALQIAQQVRRLMEEAKSNRETVTQA